ncbi:glycosyltransferase family 4 protein [Bizionia paragorgiae]|uniref:glycosyltransferase family 4 protein n=1 Tax=Bizionia paragorgiae TaxID=283786 RepID=UPI003A8E1D5A
MGLEKKRIAVICNYKLLPSRVGGMDYFYWAFNAACKNEGITVDWFFPNRADFGGYKDLCIIPNDGRNVEHHFINYLDRNTVDYSHIVTHFVELCTTFYKTVKEKQKAKLIAVDHNPRPFGGYSLKKRLKKRVKGVLYSQYIDLFVGVSKYTSEAILNDFGRFLKPKTKTIYNGVLIKDIVPKTTERAKNNPKFLVVSHLRYSKGIQDLIDAVYQLPESLKNDLIIDVYGDGPYRARLEELVNNTALESVFKFKGSVSNLATLYKEYDYLLQPTHMECFSLSILESLAANIPVITTLVGGNKEVITHGENGYLFNVENTHELSTVLEAVVCGKLSVKGSTRSLIEKRFSIDTMVSNHLELLKNAV